MHSKKPINKEPKAGVAPPSSAILGSTVGSKAIPAKWARHYARLLALRDYFRAERRDHALAAREPLETFSMSMADAATDEFDHLLALSELSAEQDALYETDEALWRIQNGTYGICELSGKPISAARLNALPWTRFSEHIGQQLERQGQQRRIQLGTLRTVTGERPARAADVPAEAETLSPMPSDELLTIFPKPPQKPRRRSH